MNNTINESYGLAQIYNVDAYEVNVILTNLQTINKSKNSLDVAQDIIKYSISNSISLREAYSCYQQGNNLKQIIYQNNSNNLASNKYYTIGKFKIILDEVTQGLKVITHENSDCLHIKPSSGNTVILIAHK